MKQPFKHVVCKILPAVRVLQDGHANVMVGLEGKRIVHTTLDDVCNTVKPVDQTMCTLVEELAV